MNKSYFSTCCSLLILSLSIIGFYSCTEKNGIQPAQGINVDTKQLLQANDIDKETELNTGRVVEEDKDVDIPGSRILGPAEGKAVSFVVDLTLSPLPAHNNFTREISFRSPLGEWKKISIDFAPKPNTTTVWTGKANWYGGIDTLISMNNTGNRWFWDDMYIENNGGSTPLGISYISIMVEYPKKDYFLTKIQIVDGILYQQLNAPYGRININQQARTGRMHSAGITSESYFNSLPLNLRTAIHDLGKTGSDGGHGMMDNNNPKYNAQVEGEGLCSEFVSWYLYAAKITITGVDCGRVYNFKDICFTGTVYEQFEDAHRLYDYKFGLKKWENIVTHIYYTPKPGDWLMLKKWDTAKNEYWWHSMILYEWDDTHKVAKVINGPWPVTIRTVDVDHLENEHDFEFSIGKIPPND